MVNNGLMMVNNWNNVVKPMENKNKPPMTGNGFYIYHQFKNGVFSGGWFMALF